MTSQSATDLRDWLASQFVSSSVRAAANLRAVADEIERRALWIEKVPSKGTDNAGAIAAQIISDVHSGIANAGLSGIVAAAARFDHEVKP